MNQPSGGQDSGNSAEQFSADWWRKAADAILRRLFDFKQGDGPPPQETGRLSKGLQLIFEADPSTDYGEKRVRGFMNQSDLPPTELATALCDLLVDRAAPLVRQRIMEPSILSAGKDAAPSAVVAAAPQSASPAGGKNPGRPTPKRPGESADWWQSWIDSRKADFDTELARRNEIFHICWLALGVDEKMKWAQTAFNNDPTVQVNRDVWWGRWRAAIAIALGARGVDDDAYHFPSLEKVPAGLESYWLLGELVHARWQADYRNAVPSHEMIMEYEWYPGGPFGRGRSSLKVHPDYRKLIVEADDASPLGVTKWAYGNWRPDILDFTTQSVWEIKPVRSAPGAVLQVWRYSHNFNCVRRFDELTGQRTRPPVEVDREIGVKNPFTIGVHPVPLQVLAPIDPALELDRYFATSTGGLAIPGAVPPERRRMRREAVERAISQGRVLQVIPAPVASLPGVILYTIVRDNRPRRPPKDPAGGVSWTTIAIAVSVVVVVVAAVVVLAGVVAGAAGSTGALAAAPSAPALAATSSVASLGTVTTIVETFGESYEASTLEAAAPALDTTLTRLSEAKVLTPGA